jgi:hypothetical protein
MSFRFVITRIFLERRWDNMSVRYVKIKTIIIGKMRRDSMSVRYVIKRSQEGRKWDRMIARFVITTSLAERR